VFGALDDTGDERQAFRAGVRLSVLPGPRTTAQLSYFYARTWSSSARFLFPADDEFDDDSSAGSQEFTSHTFRLNFRYRFTDTIFGQLNYAYVNIDSTLEGDSYYENLVLLSLTKYFY
jgi:hypothetical protein